MGGMSPTQGMAHDDGSVSFPAGPDGHFYVQAKVNGNRVTFMVDTGASDIVLTPNDARRIGFDPASLEFDQLAQTANGTVTRRRHPHRQFRGRPDRHEPTCPPTVNGAEMSESLLGMEFLNRLSGWRVENGVLTLVPMRARP